MPDLHLDASAALIAGTRDEQQDAVATQTAWTRQVSCLVLADGCGGHAGGSTASHLAVETAMAALEQAQDEDGRIAGNIVKCLLGAVAAANTAIVQRASVEPDLSDMRSTILLVLAHRNRLYWASVGDSPLYLVRDGAIRRLNKTHSFATYLDLLVTVGEITEEEARVHPGRHILTSALGAPKIDEIDCPNIPFALREGDVVLAASDGLLTLDEDDIQKTACAAASTGAAEIAQQLVDGVDAAGEEEQDNTSVAVLRVHAAEPVAVFRTRRRQTASLQAVPKTGG